MVAMTAPFRLRPPVPLGDGRQFDPLEGAWWLTAFFTIWLWFDR